MKTRRQRKSNLRRTKKQYGGNLYNIYDIFIKDSKIYIISTYKDFTDPPLTIKVNEEILKEYGVKNDDQPVRYFSGTAPKSNNVTILINGKLYKTLELNKIEHIHKVVKKNKLAYATLFKNDYFFLEKSINHYRKQGVDKFYLYYNGSTLPQGLPTGPDIVYKTWDIHPYYWNNSKCRGNSQMSFLNMFRIKYFDESDWVILCDLDEIIINPNGLSIINTIKNNTSNVIKVRNYWARLNDSKITYTTKDSGPLERTKCIYKGTFNGMIAVHHPKNFQDIDLLDLKMLHIINPVNKPIDTSYRKSYEGDLNRNSLLKEPLKEYIL